jgi:NAD-dependent deacetylase
MPRLVDDIEEAAAALAELASEARMIVGFTGAGISTECGVPDFRSPGSPWLANKPVPYEAFVASPEARREAWRRKFAMDDTYAGAAPGRGHMALAALHHAGRMPVLVTQNIDGLHQASGMPADAVVELHGNGGYARCLDCGERMELAEIRPRFEAEGHAPPCRTCGGLMKSATISFGEAMPRAELQRAARAALGCDLFLAVGSSLVVFPAADLPRAAAERGADLVIVNREHTGLDGLASLVVRADIGPVLEGMRRILRL